MEHFRGESLGEIEAVTDFINDFFFVKLDMSDFQGKGNFSCKKCPSQKVDRLSFGVLLGEVFRAEVTASALPLVMTFA